MLSHNVQLVTRISDLDTQRHVTSRTYENFCLEGRHRFLEGHGYSVARLLDEEIVLEPTHSYVRFSSQQAAGAALSVQTEVYPRPKGVIVWDQKVLQSDGKPASHIQLRTVSMKKNKPVQLLKSVKTKVAELFNDLEPFDGKCNRVRSFYTPLYCERDIFGSYSPAQLWKAFEEGRWLFSAKVGLTYERFVKMDAISFYMGGVFNFFSPLPAGKTLTIDTWIDGMEKIRYYFRQDVALDGKVLMSLRDEQLIVSMKNARPRKPPEEFLTMLADYIRSGTDNGK